MSVKGGLKARKKRALGMQSYKSSKFFKFLHVPQLVFYKEVEKTGFLHGPLNSWSHLITSLAVTQVSTNAFGLTIE